MEILGLMKGFVMCLNSDLFIISGSREGGGKRENPSLREKHPPYGFSVLKKAGFLWILKSMEKVE